MPRLVTGLFYSRQDAEAALRGLQEAGIPATDLYLEQEVDPEAGVGRKGGEVTRLETERRIAGLETGVIIGLAVGLIAGVGMGMMGSAIQDAARANGDPDLVHAVPAFLMSPTLGGLVGALFGAILGAIIGRIIDSTLDRMGAGPAPPMEETLVTVRASEDRLNDVYAALFHGHARHLHVSEAAMG
jgi:hypothetical protein